jgi:hypothetical protein
MFSHSGTSFLKLVEAIAEINRKRGLDCLLSNRPRLNKIPNKLM